VISANRSEHTVLWQFCSTKNSSGSTTWTISTFSGHLDTGTLHIPNATVGHVHFHRNTSTERVDIYVLTDIDGPWEECTDRWAISGLPNPITHPLYESIILDTYGEDKWSPNYITMKTYVGRKHAYGGLKRYNDTMMH